MKAPKILPWVAHKTGISEDLALKLWRRAAGEAEEMTGRCDSSDYYRLAVERFIDLSEAEGNSLLVRETPSVTCVFWLWRHQSRMSSMHLLAHRTSPSSFSQESTGCCASRGRPSNDHDPRDARDHGSRDRLPLPLTLLPQGETGVS
jgi:hypothetical protein